MDCVYDTELEEVCPAVSFPEPSELYKYENLIPSDEEIDIETQMNDAVFSSTGDTIVEYPSSIVIQNEPKTFEQSGFEVACILCISIIAGLVLWDTLSKRWFT